MDQGPAGQASAPAPSEAELRARLASQLRLVGEMRKAGFDQAVVDSAEAGARALEAQVAALRPLQDRYTAALQRAKAREARFDAAMAKVVATREALAAYEEEATRAESEWVATQAEVKELLRQLSAEKDGPQPLSAPAEVAGWLQGLLHGPACKELDVILLQAAAVQAAAQAQAAAAAPVVAAPAGPAGGPCDLSAGPGVRTDADGFSSVMRRQRARRARSPCAVSVGSSRRSRSPDRADVLMVEDVEAQALGASPAGPTGEPRAS
jgi:hypothetical protein